MLNPLRMSKKPDPYPNTVRNKRTHVNLASWTWMLYSLNVINVHSTEDLKVDNSIGNLWEENFIISFGNIIQLHESAIKFARLHSKLMWSFYINLEEVIFFLN